MGEELLQRKLREIEKFPYMLTAWDSRGKMIYRDHLPSGWGDKIRDMAEQLVERLRTKGKGAKIWILCKLEIMESGCLEDEKYTATAKEDAGNTK